MIEPFGYREALERRIRIANRVANGAGGLTVVCGVMALGGLHADLWMIGGTFTLATTIFAVRVVTTSKIALIQLGKPGPKVVPNHRNRHRRQ